MRCPVTECARQTFREQVPGVIERYQRRTVRLGEQVRAVCRDGSTAYAQAVRDALPNAIQVADRWQCAMRRVRGAKPPSSNRTT